MTLWAVISLAALAGCAPSARTSAQPVASAEPIPPVVAAAPPSALPAASASRPASASASVSGSASASPSSSRSAAKKAATTFWDASNIPVAKNVFTVKVLNRTNGKYPDSEVYWTFGGQTRSIAQQPYLDMPANSSGRMYFHLGSPTGKYADFIEFTVGTNQFNGNTTRVDAFVLKIAMRLHSKDGSNLTVGETPKVFAESRATTFARFRAAVPAEFKHLAEGTDRILSPGGDPEFKTGGKYANYFPSSTSAASTSDILGCAGTLAAKPDECARLNRHVTAASANKVGAYYKAAPANFYAKFWHDNAIDGRAYGFPYDDVNAQSSYISHSDPRYLLVAVGF